MAQDGNGSGGEEQIRERMNRYNNNNWSAENATTQEQNICQRLSLAYNFLTDFINHV